MLHYGLEFEYFIAQRGIIVPASQVLAGYFETDGNPAIGEIRTEVHTSMVDAVFELKKLIFQKQEWLKDKKAKMIIKPRHTVSEDFVKEVRARYHSDKKDSLKELSIYNGKTGRVLPPTELSASLQINISDNGLVSQVSMNGKEKVSNTVWYSKLFDFTPLIKNWDKVFADDISKTGRTSGVYAFKDGKKGNRVEYRSLPNTVSLEKLAKVS